MKTKFLLVVFMSLLSFTTIYAAPKNKGVEIRISEKATPAQAQRAREIQARFNEIQAMDVERLSHEQKLALKKEIRDLKHEARQMDAVYFYFGGGFLLLLILLIILL
jgi:hypothetical protein